MSSEASFVTFSAGKAASRDADNSSKTPLSASLLQRDDACIMLQPHAGSTGSIVTKLPYPIVSVCRADTAGIVSLVVLMDNFLPDATKARIAQAGVCRRIFLLKVTHTAAHWHPTGTPPAAQITRVAGVAVLGLHYKSGLGAHSRRLLSRCLAVRGMRFPQ
jgi:hypothetical protein